MRGLKGKTAIVTGGATGIGAAIVRRLVEEGVRVGVLDRRPPAEQAGAGLGGGARFEICDITRDAEIERATGALRAAFGPAHILVNNAALFLFYGADAPREEFEKICQVNILGTSRVTHYVLPQLRENRGGSIVNLSSVSGFAGQKGFATYTATKFAIRGLTKAWATDLGAEGIRVNAVIPSAVRTEAFEAAVRDMGLTLEQARRKYGAWHLLRRIAEPAEVAAAVAFAASDEASFMTGSDLIVDGGYLAAIEKDPADGPPSLSA